MFVRLQKSTFILKALTVLLLACLPLGAIAQKAYETELYTSTLKGKKVKLSLANGYAGASVISWYTHGKNKPILFIPESGVPNEDYVFRPEKERDPGYFILKNIQEAYNHLPRYIKGYYLSGKFSLPLKFRRI
ncbi:MAG: hypothetical protein ABIN91_17595 [Mucilaginibacter sp.]|uniref:hypothetical protein n=1 Tax=Mucilaginibacter sp. TaxID=1882438 RepID=UPI00326337A5